MNLRRFGLAMGLCLLTVSAGRRVRAATGEVEVAGYGGESTGGWVCGPVGPMRYGGVAANVQVAARSIHDRAGEGWVVGVGAAGEHQSTRFTKCETEGCTSKEDRPPPDSVLLGGQWRGGYHARNWGVDAGGGVYQGFRTAGDQSPSVAMYPQLEARGGVSGPTAVFGVVGFGSPLVTSPQRPGLYTGMKVDSHHGFGVDARLGIYRQGPALTDGESLTVRGDLAGRVHLTKAFALRAGGAIGAGSDNAQPRPNLEGSGGFVAQF